MQLLICGGAGYIGSHMVRYLQGIGHDVVVLDNLSTGHPWAFGDFELLKVDLLDQETLARLLKGRQFDGVVHLAAKSLVGESVQRPDFYYRNNVTGTLNLLTQMLANDMQNIVFSSTAAIFGRPVTEKIAEDHPKQPINPYGQSKLVVESLLADMCAAYQLNAVALRYFNAAGADPSGEIGEAHSPETHLIPNVLNSLAAEQSNLQVFGNDYDTRDGTCVRDYVHVNDLAQAHWRALQYMASEHGFSAFNLGNGDGFSVLEVIDACANVVGKPIDYQIKPRRHGDPASLVADSAQAQTVLGWAPEYHTLDSIVASAWAWHRSFTE